MERSLRMKQSERSLLHSEMWMCMKEHSQYKSRQQSLPISRCSTKLALLDRMQLSKEGAIKWNSQSMSQKTLEVQIEHPLSSQIEPLNQKWTHEEESQMRHSSPGPETKVQKLICLQPVKNSPETCLQPNCQHQGH